MSEEQDVTVAQDVQDDEIPRGQKSYEEEIKKLRAENAKRRIELKEVKEQVAAVAKQQTEAMLEESLKIHNERLAFMERELKLAKLAAAGVSAEEDVELVDFYVDKKGFSLEQAAEKVLSLRAPSGSTGFSADSQKQLPVLDIAGKSFTQLTYAEKCRLQETNPELFKQLSLKHQ